MVELGGIHRTYVYKGLAGFWGHITPQDYAILPPETLGEPERRVHTQHRIEAHWTVHKPLREVGVTLFRLWSPRD
jgi:hypothetical protein